VQQDAGAAVSQPTAARGLRLRWALLVALAGGLLLAVAFPPAGIWPLAVAGPALLAVALRGRSLRASFCVGLVFGVALFFPLLSWVLNTAWYAWAALAGAEAVIFAVLAIGQRLLLNLRIWPLAVAGWWVAAEAFRDRWPWGGFPWGRLVMSQAGAPTAGWAAIGGAPFASFVIALVGGTLAWLIVTLTTAAAARRTANPPEGTWFPGSRKSLVFAGTAFAVSVVAAVIPAAFTVDPVSAQARTAEVAAIQGNVPRQRGLTAQLNDSMVTANHAAATNKLAKAVKAGKISKPQVVIWPENSTDIDPEYDSQIFDEIANSLADVDAPILVGEILQNPAGTVIRNAGVLWTPGQGPGPSYVKRRLVPFGEVIPFRSILQKITPLTALQPVNFTPGDRAVVFHIGDIRLGDVICYEVGFDDLVRSEATNSNLLTVQTNDADFEWDGQTGETGQQLAMSRISAVEYDRAVAVASTTGYSALIEPDGKLAARSGTWRQATLEAKLPLVSYTTLADRVGPWPEYVITVLTALAAAVAAATAIRGRRFRLKSPDAA
jgi:apolipoprotein N-acyltransferase